MMLRHSILTLFCAAALHADVRLFPLFTDHAVLQCDKPVPVWGWADSGEVVTASFGGQSIRTTTGASGRWRVNLAPSAASAKPADLVVTGKNTVTIRDVLVGEVWLCSGQSNMEFPLNRSADAPAVIAASADPALRLFTVPHHPSDHPEIEVKSAWRECNPASAAPFSAVAYFFGRDIRQARHVPVGLIESAYGGTPAEAWTAQEVMAGDPQLQPILAAHEREIREFPQQLAKFKAAQAKSGKENQPTAKATPAPINPAQSPKRPSALYNGMIAPLVPFAMRGVIWYQGEANSRRAEGYAKLFSAMIGSWRQVWGLGDFPFLFVQIAPRTIYTPELREAQLRTWQRVPNTAMAVTTDWGLADDSHPPWKQPVGHRLALAARALAYGEVLEYSGPVYDSLKVEGDRAILSFTHVGRGLLAKGGELKGFTIAGADRKFVPAQARIERGTVVVSSPHVARPLAVRYGFDLVPDVNLFNEDDLPATPFRTDGPGLERRLSK